MPARADRAKMRDAVENGGEPVGVRSGSTATDATVHGGVRRSIPGLAKDRQPAQAASPPRPRRRRSARRPVVLREPSARRCLDRQGTVARRPGAPGGPSTSTQRMTGHSPGGDRQIVPTPRLELQGARHSGDGGTTPNDQPTDAGDHERLKRARKMRPSRMQPIAERTSTQLLKVILWGQASPLFSFVRFIV